MNTQAKTQVAQGVAEQLWATEEQLDAALAEAARLMEVMMAARKDVGLSTTVGGEIVLRVSEAMGSIAQARQALTAAHTGLAVIHRKIGADPVVGGPANKDEEVGRPTGIARVA